MGILLMGVLQLLHGHHNNKQYVAGKAVSGKRIPS